MAAFEYRPYDSSRWTGSLADIIRAKGDIPAQALLRNAAINADAARQSGQIWGGAVAGIGQQVSGMIQQQNDPRRKLEQITLDRAQQEQTGQAALTKLQTPTMPNGPMQEGETRTPQNPYMRKEGDTWVWDTSALGEAMAAQGKPLTPTLLKSISDFNETNRQEMQHRIQFGATQQKLVGQAAGVLAGLLRAHPDTDLNAAGQLIGQQFAANGSFPLDKFNATFQQVAGDPSTALAKLEALSRIGAEPIKLGDNDKLLNSNDPGGTPLATNPKPPTPFSLNPGETRYDEAGKPIVTAPAAPVKPPKVALGSFEDYVGRKYGTEPTPAQIEEARKTYQQADDRPRVNVQVGPPGTEGGLTPDGLALAATAYRLTRQLPSRNASQNAAIMNEAAKQAATLGQTPATVIQKQAAQKADGAALTKMTTMSSAAESFETKANAQAGLVADLSKKVSRTQWPLANGILMTGKVATGDTDAQLFGNALLTFTSEYAKIMEGATGSSAGSSDAARKDAARLISTALNNGTIQKTVQQMQWEMRQTILGYDTVIGHINERLGGAPPAASPATAAASTTIRARDPQGVLHEAAAGTALPSGWKLEP